MPIVSSEPQAAPPRTKLRWWHWLLLGLALLAGVVAVALWQLDPWLRRQLETQVAEQTKGRYQLRVQALHTHLLSGSLRLHGLHLRTVGTADSARLPPLRLDLARLTVTGVGISAILRKQIVPIDSIGLDSLYVRLAGQLSPDTASAKPLYQRLPLHLPGLRLGSLTVLRVQAAYRPTAHDSAWFRRADLRLRDVLVAAGAIQDSQRIGYAGRVAAAVAGGRLVAVQHRVALGAVRYSSRQRRLQLDSLVVHPLIPVSDRRTRASRVDLLLPRLLAEGFRANRLNRRLLSADLVRVSAPRLVLVAPQLSPVPLHELLAPALRQVKLKNFVLTKGSLYIVGLKQHPKVKNVAIKATDLKIDSASAGEKGRLYYARNWQLHTGPVNALLSGPYYKVAYQELDLATQTGRLDVKNVWLRPTMSPAAMNRRKGYQSPHITVLLPQLSFRGVDFPAFTRRGQLLMREMLLLNARIQTRGDGRFPINPNRSVASPELIGQLPFRVDIRRLTARNGTFFSEYRPPKNATPGRLSFTRFAVSINNISNDPRHMNAAHPAVGYATAWLQNHCRAHVKLVANLLDPAGRHRMTGHFGAASLGILNPMTEEVSFLRFREGQVQDIRFRLQLDRRQAHGTTWAVYSDLKVSMLTPNGGRNRKTILTRIGSGLLNGIVVRDNNPRRGQLIVGEVTTTRDLRNSVFTLWQHGLVASLLNSVGVPAKISADLMESE